MRNIRILLSLWLCLTLPYTALASALRDPQCLQAHVLVNDVQVMAMQDQASSAMGSDMLGMSDMHHDMSAMPMSDSSASLSHHHAAGHCGCLLGCACVQACAAPACNSGLDGKTGMALATLTQESPRTPLSVARLSAARAELLRPPALRV